MSTKPDEVLHGLAEGAYDNMMMVAFGRPHMKVWCLCGWVSTPAESWEEAGADLDEHLATVRS